MNGVLARILAAMLTLAALALLAFWLGQSGRPKTIADTHGPQLARAVPAPRHAAPPKGWTKIDAEGRFGFFAPPGTRLRPRQGTDSFVGEITGPNFKLQFDYGAYSNDLSEIHSPHGDETPTIEGHRAVIKTVDDVDLRDTIGAPYHHFVGIYVGAIKCSRMVIGLGCRGWDSLEISGGARRQEDIAVVKTIFRSLEFAADPLAQ